MAYHIDTHHLPRIYGYDHAKRIFDSITPIRGGDQSVRRLGKRSDANKWIKHEIREGVDVFIAGLYSTDVVTFYPSHYEIYMGGWDSMSTRKFIEAIQGMWCSSIRESDYIPKGYSNLNEATVMYAGHPISASHKYKFDYDHKPLSPLLSLQKYKVNRKKMNAVRREFKSFVTYMETMDGLQDTKLENGGYMRAWRASGDRLRMAQDQDSWWELFQALAWSSRDVDWGRGSPVYHRRIKGMKRDFDNMLKVAFSREVLEAV